MEALFYLAGAGAVIATILVIVQPNPVHALLYLIVSMLSIALVFYILGAVFAAALEVIIYAGAILVLFVFVVMMLNLGPENIAAEKAGLRASAWVGPLILGALLLGELICVLSIDAGRSASGAVEPRAVALALFGPYLLGVELASLLLLSGLVGAHHLGRHWNRELPGKETNRWR